ncbi:hypothetical protein [Marinomonas algicola]|uniref:hypothetical protein n=1 Tax=Marinomonas algicola TaxID=2773454 RepID=UPI00174BA4DB|nr:hypothetical protein [Marinomonas algicola]
MTENPPFPDATAKRLPVIDRVTSKYDEVQDRMLFVCAMNDESVTSIWMTQRLLTRFVPILLNWLQEQMDVSDKVQAEAFHSLAQTRAQVAMKENSPVIAPTKRDEEEVQRNTPVIVSGRADEWLATTITLSKRPQELVLKISEADEVNAVVLPLPVAALRQWLCALQLLTKRSEWAVEWPTWLATEESAPVSSIH